LVASAKQEYEFVILDSAPLLALADTRLLAPKVSGVLLVVKNASIPREQFLHALSSIRAGGNLIGVILNGVDLRTNGYYYNDYSQCASADKPAFEEIYRE